MTEGKFKRLITAFLHGSDARAFTIEIEEVPTERLVEIFDPPPDDPLLIDPYQINVDQASLLIPYLVAPLDLSKYDYYLEAEG